MKTGCLLLGPLLLLAACAVQPPAPGSTEAQAVAALGRVTGRYPLPGGGQRLEFATGPMGRTTWMVDLGPDGRSTRAEQVLNTAHFAAFAERAPGMTPDELLRTLGRPGERRPAGLAGGETWSWRYPTNECLWFQVSVGADGRVIGGGYGIDPVCDVNDNARP
ncbi:MAG: hypothetical protein JNM08_10750 [Rubrivivax sp.]|nr:hypothetical protein [Rubrivivax sp.]